MKIISIKVHGILDYLTVLIFAVAPTMFGFSGAPSYLSYALSGIHFLMSALTNFPLGAWKVIPVSIHKLVETIVGPVLIVLPWIFGFASDLPARYFFLALGFVIIAVGLLTNYMNSEVSVEKTRR